MRITSLFSLTLASVSLFASSAAMAQDLSNCYALVVDETCADEEQVDWFRSDVSLRAPSECEADGWSMNWVVREDLCELVVSSTDPLATESAIAVPVPAFPSRDEVRDAAVRATLVMGWVPDEPDVEPQDVTESDPDETPDPVADVENVVEADDTDPTDPIDEDEDPEPDSDWQGGSLVDGLHQTGGWVALHFSGARYNGATTLMSGIRGGVSFNHSLTVGLAAAIDTIGMEPPESLSQGRKTFMGMTYGGLFTQLEFVSESTVHFGIELVLGLGAAYWATDDDDDGQLQEREMDRMRTAPFGIVSPGVHAAVRILPWMRFIAGATYRWVPYVDQRELRDEDLDGLTIDLAIAFGTL